ncbi:MAG: bifunctional folylpolyglutamate synthase/dihydrofolate synthase [Alphaproteobacteria bacterium]|nr:bifunctional folylpolyglutamate synthase/dihydrofolate synthase [Alphaproteobacteria bacterium SS10]
MAGPGTPDHPVDAILARLLTLHPKLIDLSLSRIERLLDALGRPDQQLPPVIHVAGTNGKGSTIAFIAALAATHGLRVHCYTSPHLTRFNERIALSPGAGQLPQPIDDAPLEAYLAKVEAANGGEPITFFEITTAAAFLAFADNQADLLLLETGLGGRVDATNVLLAPAVTAITPVGMDHMGFLGETLAAIAGEKAGIIKPGRPVVIGPQAPEALSVIQARAAELQAPIVALPDELPGEPGLTGAHQQDNARTALAAFKQFAADRSVPLTDDKLSAGLAMAKWPGRLQPVTLTTDGTHRQAHLDGAHNPEGMRAVMGAWDQMTAGQPKGDLVIGVMANKALDPMLDAIVGRFARIVAVPVPDTDAGLPAEDLAHAISQHLAGHDIPTRVASGWQDALAQLGQTEAPLLIAGSLYLIGGILRDQDDQNQRLALVGT